MQKLNRPDPDFPSGRFCPDCGAEEPHYWYDVEPMYDEMWLRVRNYRPGVREWYKNVYEACVPWGAHIGLIETNKGEIVILFVEQPPIDLLR